MRIIVTGVRVGLKTKKPETPYPGSYSLRYGFEEATTPQPTERSSVLVYKYEVWLGYCTVQYRQYIIV